METFLIRALQLILSLSILVVLHEFGHFAFARLFKVRVEKFYMFFNPNFSLIRAKKIKGKWDVKFFSKNVAPKERVKLDAFGKEVVDSKGKPILNKFRNQKFRKAIGVNIPKVPNWELVGCRWAVIARLQAWWTKQKVCPIWAVSLNRGSTVPARFGNDCQL